MSSVGGIVSGSPTQARKTPEMDIHRAGQGSLPSSKKMVRSMRVKSMIWPSSERQRSAAQGRRSAHRSIMLLPPLKGGASGHTLVPGVTRPTSSQWVMVGSATGVGSGAGEGEVSEGQLQANASAQAAIIASPSGLEVDAFFDFELAVHAAVFAEADVESSAKPVAIHCGVDVAGDGTVGVGLAAIAHHKPPCGGGVVGGDGQFSVLDFGTCVRELQCVERLLRGKFIGVQAVLVVDPRKVIASDVGRGEHDIRPPPKANCFADFFTGNAAGNVGESAAAGRQEDEGQKRNEELTHGVLRNPCYRREVGLTTGGCDERSVV